MEKLKKYNQLLLAIAGTGILLFFLFMAIVFIFDELKYRWSDDDPFEQGIIATEETDQLLQDSLRKQIISFKEMNLIDSANRIYLLPVRQATISEGESTDDLLGLVNLHSGSGNKFRKYNRRRDVTFNNMVIFNAEKNISDIVFNERVSISEYIIIEKENETFLLLTGTDKDSNKDKYINDEDLQELFIYELATKKLTKIKANENHSTLVVHEQQKTKDVIGKFDLDRNENGEFDLGVEPMVFYLIDLENKKLINTVNEDQVNTLQKLLEGR